MNVYIDTGHESQTETLAGRFVIQIVLHVFSLRRQLSSTYTAGKVNISWGMSGVTRCSP